MFNSLKALILRAQFLSVGGSPLILWPRFLLIGFFLFVGGCASHQKGQEAFDMELSQFQYPFEVKDFQLMSQNQKLTMRYGDLGDKTSDKVVVLLHGKNFSGYYWNSIATQLVEKRYRVIIPDQIGFGKSSKPEYYQYSFPQLAHNTLQLLRSLNIQKFTLVGHSMGGMLAVHLATMSEDVEKLILVNPIGLEDYLQYVEFKDPEFFFQSEINKTVDQFRDYQKKNYYDGNWSDRYESLLAPFKGWRQGPDWKQVAWNNALTYGPIFTDEIVSKFSQLKMSTYLILGTRDKTGPGRGWMKQGVRRTLGQYEKLGHDVRAMNPNKINLIELSGLGHMPQFEDESRFAKVFYPLFD